MGKSKRFTKRKLKINQLLSGGNMSIDYEKMSKVFTQEEKERIDAMINVSEINWISKWDEEMIRSKFTSFDELGNYKNHMTDRERELFVVIKTIGMGHVNFLINSIVKLLKKD